MSLVLQLMVFQLTILGSFGQVWNVSYHRGEICALKGSTVILNSTFSYPSYPSHLTVEKKFWIINPVKGVIPPDLKNNSDYSDRIEYLEDQKNSFSLKLKNVTEKDQHTYCVRITTKVPGQQYQGHPGVIFRVTDLRVESPQHVSEGNTTNLQCVTTCGLTDNPEFTWFKNGEPLHTNTERRNIIVLKPTRTDHMSRYRCAVRGYEHLSSPDVYLNVTYSPKNVFVSISPSGEIVEGSSVTLTCNSDGNPPVENFTWFRNSTWVINGKTFSISKIAFEDHEEYKCKASNTEGYQYSVGVTLNVTGGQSKALQAVIGIIPCIVLCFAVVAVILLRRKKKCCWSENSMFKQSNTDPVKQDVLGHVEGSKEKPSLSGDTEEVQYATVHKVQKKTQEEDVHYASVVFHNSPGSAEDVEDPSVIYSSVR